MNPRDISDSLKKATVAVMTRRENSGAGHPFKIIGSGFCVHPAGIVITANHVFQSFVKDQHHKSVLERVGEGVMVPTPMTVFGLLFYGGAKDSKVYMHEAVPSEVGIVNDFDIAVFKIRDHPEFPHGFPALEIADYAELHEMMPVATCGYPFGDFLWHQVGSDHSQVFFPFAVNYFSLFLNEYSRGRAVGMWETRERFPRAVESGFCFPSVRHFHGLLA